MADVNVNEEIRWALMALSLVRNRLIAMGIKAEDENGTALINLDAAIATLTPIGGVSLPLDAQRHADFEAGWRTAAEWARRDDLLTDIGSPAYIGDRAEALARGVGGTDGR